MTKQIVSGVLLLDKPSGISSYAALTQAKRLFMSPKFDSKKAGHTGTLDPMATGILPICFGDATKFSSFGLDADKGYTAIIKLGEKTDTGDKEGQIIAQKDVPVFEQSELDKLAVSLMGEQMQTPPMYSALKKDGKKLYEYARDGIEIERQPRPIVIHHLALNKLSNDEITLDVICSKGTYVRVLGETVAERLGTVGHLTALHRTSTGGFDVADAISLDDLADLSLDERLGRLLPTDVMLGHLPMLRLTMDETARIKMGQRLNVKDRLDDVNFGDDAIQIRLYHDDDFVGLGQVAMSGRLQPIKVVHCY
ncbi:MULTISPECIES: tRNA pseudouridine(55) synthase TruB [Moraxella]|uniref:tRNA pseudouridine synthase B n=1 Tax=Moraxella lacunata TaxID=477 RepID=A0A1B8PZI8_MORLA|nr:MULTISPECIES: tRNA pseudouridine(55) synthase TruB [Moraxella]MBE9578233.1 tRNA pseudouridine(55) synthase TruB [Moraxella sp. K1664]MBE9588870.1 tRNA pseudouridine(55) synthase TruB [Moraxella sp. K1630]MBE9597082.1 tRNA pseudouridine(55) synthase TruB [Moraxella sp. K2450]MDH9219613.1 tRNA pseudouridine(55) synthase TruB [Moraxella lacunata]MDI4483530.1 tRNA pseudouridine(55) synthase TruB [Moraxella lacunata]